MSDAPRLLEFDFVKKLAVPFFERANTASHADLLAQRENMFVHYYQSAIQGYVVRCTELVCTSQPMLGACWGKHTAGSWQVQARCAVC